ncbi:DUF6985 domain-containing protein [Alkanindiges illinoisensis]|uniref:DUF6985 domain-containing protein n=1 Tax=Alkanindiges illinoisensis TaxID=197183 RepID=UPI0004793CED|nr:hypothetical protein [Alkanindiges illinoisensis]
MDIPNLGTVIKEPQFGHYQSQPVYIPMLEQSCYFDIEGYETTADQESYHTAIANFLNASPEILKAAQPYIFQYYQVMNSFWEPGDEEYIEIHSPDQIWNHIELGDEAAVSRRTENDQDVYITLSCECDWEPEHGLMIVFKNGSQVCKVGAYDGHVTNSDAYADDALENVIYYTTLG